MRYNLFNVKCEKSTREYKHKTEKSLENTIIVNRELWETRVAVLEKGILQDLYFERKENPDLEKGFIKGKVSNVLPGIQTVFVEIGQPKAGFLHISEVDRDFAIEKFKQEGEDNEISPRKKIRKHQINISKIFKNKEEILVQVKKEAQESKGAKLTTCFTLPGKYLVLMPNISHIGVSSKIGSRAERSRLREIMDKYLPEEMGVILRTDAENKTEDALKGDLSFLIKTWEGINNKFKSAKVGEMIHSDLPLVVRTIREHIDEETVTIICNNQDDLDAIQKFLFKVMPKSNVTLKLETKKNLFREFNIDKQIESLLHKKVHLKSGGNIVIEHAEAMTVVDINTAKFTGKGDQEETTLQTNMEAAKEIVRQLRLRNIGGIIIIDFIDMHKGSNKQTLMGYLDKELKTRDKLKSTTLNISELGLIQMTRKRAGRNLSQQMLEMCTDCKGTGLRKSISSTSFEVLRAIKDQIMLSNLQGKKLEVSVAPAAFDYLSKVEFEAILGLEKVYGVKIILLKSSTLKIDDFKIIVSKS